MSPSIRCVRLVSRFGAIGLISLLCGGGISCARAASVEPVEFRFAVPASKQNPFARDLWAEVTTPAHRALRLPAFFVGDDRFAVRARADELGEYVLGHVTEVAGPDERVIPLAADSPRSVTVTTLQSMPQIHRADGLPARFVFPNGRTFVPVGANLVENMNPARYRAAFPEFAGEGLNWVRLWMANWTGTNLDWSQDSSHASPVPGTLDLAVAGEWDRIITAAETAGVYLQVVLQHHGQYSTAINPNWADNPWNMARGGFLASPSEFFTSPQAIELSARKYRYIAARWGYSPAILSWEFFNEVHWVDALRRDHDETAVARWHTRMASFLRTVDTYHHLLTTSTEDLRSPIYDSLDYFQPHHYPANLLAGPRSFQTAPQKLDRPVFYGEIGDDHAMLSAAQQAAGSALVPPVWASLMGEGRYPAQPWLGDRLLSGHRLGELGAVARFLTASRLAEREGLEPFSAVVDCAVHVPLAIRAGEAWQRGDAPEFDLPLDGRDPVELGRVPLTYVGAPESLADGFPGHVNYRVDLRHDTAFRAIVTGMDQSGKATALRILIDGEIAAEKSWAPGAADTPRADRPAVLAFTVKAGRHTVVVENPGAPAWFELSRLEIEGDIPILAAVGRRGPDFIAVWLWHRLGAMQPAPSAEPVAGTLVLENVTAGSWHVTWWDTIKGLASSTTLIEHPGGTLRLPTPAIGRHAAVVLTR